MRNKLPFTILVLLFILTIMAIWTLQPVSRVNSQIFPTFPVITLPPTLSPTATRTPTPVQIGNFAWDDLDKDGLQDAGEPGLEGVTVQLWNSTRTQLISQWTTGPTGIYQVTAPRPGDYYLRAVLPGALDHFSPKHQGNDELKDSDINPSGALLGFSDLITLPPNLISTTQYDVGIIVFRTTTPTPPPNPINLGNLVWNDQNQNGIQDTGEGGVSGVFVQLWNATKTQFFVQYTTSASGLYQLTAPYPGDYRIRFVPPFGSSFSPKDQGANDDKDSDVNLSGDHIGFTDVITLTSNATSVTNIDAGLIVAVPPPNGWSLIFLPMIKK